VKVWAFNHLKSKMTPPTLITVVVWLEGSFLGHANIVRLLVGENCELGAK